MNWLFRLLDWYKDYRLSVIKAKADVVNRPYEAMADVAKSQADFLKGWLDSFKVTEVPRSTIIRDEDEWRMEQDRLREQQGDVTLDPEIKQSIENAMKAGAFPELRDILNR